MSKKLNYYQVHKNKKPKKKVSASGLHPRVKECIRIATEIINKAIERAQILRNLSQPIPKYKKGNNNVSHAGGFITGDKGPEVIVDNFGRTAKHIGEYEKLTKALKDRMNLTSITSEELTNGNQTFIELMNNISISNKSILNAKAPN